MICKICGGATQDIGSKHGRFSGRTFHLRQCPNCYYSFVSDPWTDFAAIYSEDYYSGRGADPQVDYLFELEHPEEIPCGPEYALIDVALALLVWIRTPAIEDVVIVPHHDLRDPSQDGRNLRLCPPLAVKIKVKILNVPTHFLSKLAMGKPNVLGSVSPIF